MAQPASWDREWDGEQQPAVWRDDGRAEHQLQPPASRRERRDLRVRQRVQAREARWQRNRLAVPYRTDGPRITFGVLWFVAILGAALTSPLAVAGVAGLVAALAGLQTGMAWLPARPGTKWWTAAAAFVAGLAGFLGPYGLAAGAGVALIILLVHALVEGSGQRTTTELVDVLVRSALPAGLAAAALAALAEHSPGAVLTLIALVSAYEVGDFVVGSGSSNAVEGPLSGLVALGTVVFSLWVIAPAPFSAQGMLLFGALAAVCCPLGQILASALLPRGNAWAPALRRLDSYLLAAPLWLILLSLSPTASAL